MGFRHGAPNIQTSIVTRKVVVLATNFAIGSNIHIRLVAGCSKVQKLPAFACASASLDATSARAFPSLTFASL